MSRMKVMQNEEEIILFKTKLVEFAKDIYKTKVGIRNLRKMGLTVGYKRLPTNEWIRSDYYLMKVTPQMKSLIETMPKRRTKGVLKELPRKGLNVILFLRRISSAQIPVRRQVFEYFGCALLRCGVVIDAISA